jgi:UDP-N-acetylmuramoyl-L-alanyl-D-glutamate--2,6-diaminopimelate ligase
MKLAELMSPWNNNGTSLDCEILGLQNDSRKIQPGFLFFAYPGAAVDGRTFIAQALSQGAAAVVYEPDNWPQDCLLPSDRPCIPMPGLAAKLATIASRFYGEPTKKLSLTGVTGTNGKTTIAYQLAQAHALLGESSAYIGTIGQGPVNALEPLANTTPDALFLQTLFNDYLKQSVKQVCMEVSSHALCQHRVDCIDFQQAIFSNLSHEHLDYHQSMDAYAAAKARLFASPTLKWAIINQDDPYSEFMRSKTQAEQVITYGLKEGADLRAVDWRGSLTGTELEVASPWGQAEFAIKALGFFNVYNSLAVFASLLAAGYPMNQVQAQMANLQAAPGRMEIVSEEPYVIVDYAHSPDALENVLSTLQALKKGRIILVFGCGGDRDKTKRAPMGKIASDYADLLILTNDNPRSEDPLTIIEAIEAGISPAINRLKITDRAEAIAKAISLADKEDIVLVAGKGHEDYQQIGTIRHSFSDQAVVRKINFL